MFQSPSKNQLIQRPGNTMNTGARGTRTLQGGSPDASPMHQGLKSPSKAGTLRKRLLSPKRSDHHHHHDDHHHHGHVELKSPTSISMKNSYIIKNADPSFETYYNTMKKRSKVLSSLPAIPESAATIQAPNRSDGVRT